MYNIIEKYMSKLKIEDVEKFAISKNVFLSPEELQFTYAFIKKNGSQIIKNPNVFDIDRYCNKYTPDNFKKIKQIYKEYFQKFRSLL